MINKTEYQDNINICKRDYVTLIDKGIITLETQAKYIFRAFLKEKDEMNKFVLKERLVILIAARKEYNEGSFRGWLYSLIFGDVRKAIKIMEQLKGQESEEGKKTAIKAMNKQIFLLKANSVYGAPGQEGKKGKGAISKKELEQTAEKIKQRNFALQENGDFCEYQTKNNSLVIINHKSDGEKYTYENLLLTPAKGANKELWEGEWSINNTISQTVAVCGTRDKLRGDKRKQTNARIKRENQFLLNHRIPGAPRMRDHFGLMLSGKETYFQVSDLSDIGNLATCIQKIKNLTPTEMKEAMLNILSTLSALHKNGFIHRDIKPENILVYRDGFVLIDYEFFTSVDDEKEKSKRRGTPEFMAPEYIRGLLSEEKEVIEKATTEKIDIWALGATFFQMMDRQLLWQFLGIEKRTEEGSRRFLMAAPKAQARIIQKKITHNTDAVQNQLWEIIASMLDADPKKRPTAQQLYNQVREIRT